MILNFRITNVIKNKVINMSKIIYPLHYRIGMGSSVKI